MNQKSPPDKNYFSSPQEKVKVQNQAYTPTQQREEQEISEIAVIGMLGFDDSHRPDTQLGFFDMGMNYSTMLKLRDQLQTDLGCLLSITTFSDHFNIQELSKYLIKKIMAS